MQSVEFEWLLISVCLPRRPNEAAGVLVLDRNSDRLFLKLKSPLPDWDEEVALVWRELSAELTQRAMEIGADQVVNWLELTASHTIRLSTRRQRRSKGPKEVLDQLYGEYVEKGLLAQTAL